MTIRTYGEASRLPAHHSFFRQRLEKQVRSRGGVGAGDPVHEYLVDQANLRGYRGAASARSDLGCLDRDLSIEEIVVGLLQPHAPAEPRIVKLVVRILQSGTVSPERLMFLARRERALANLAWVVDLVPERECNAPLAQLSDRLRRNPPREVRRPRIRYARERLLRRPAGR